jgi:hypothetical protein
VSAIAISLIVFACVFGGGLLGLLLRTLLPGHHVSEEAKDVVRVVTGLVATVSALVLGLLVASAKSSFDTMNDESKQLAAKIILLDRVLARYGSETKDVREVLRRALSARVESLFSADANERRSFASPQSRATTEEIENKILELVPKTDAQRSLHARALQISGDVAQMRWLVVTQGEGTISPAFLTVLVSWLAAIFVGFGLFAPRNTTAVAALLIGALAVAASIFLIEEMDRPLDGFIAISSAPLRSAVGQLGQ